MTLPNHDHLLDAIPDSVVVVGRDGALLRANTRARSRLAALAGGVPATVADFLARLRPRRSNGTLVDESDLARFFSGELLQAQFTLPSDAGRRRIHISVGGTTEARVVVARDITELHQSIELRAARSTARSIAHNLNSLIGSIMLNSDMLPEHCSDEAGEMTRQIGAAAQSAGDIIGRMQQVVRYAEMDIGIGAPLLDLAAATEA